MESSPRPNRSCRTELEKQIKKQDLADLIAYLMFAAE